MEILDVGVIETQEDDLQETWTEFLGQWPFEWFGSLTFEHPVSRYTARREVNDWHRRICIEEQLQLGCFSIFNEFDRSHVHSLMLGRNREGKTLMDVLIEPWLDEWEANADIQEVYDIEGVADYCVRRNLFIPNPDLSDYWTYNQKLLRKFRVGLRERDSSIAKSDHEDAMSEMIERILDGIEL